MGYLTLRLTMERIGVATKTSPIAVFRCSKPEHLRSVFAATAETRRVLNVAGGDPSLIGVFHRNMNTTRVENLLRLNIK